MQTLSERKVKREIKRIIKEKEKGLVRLRFDAHYADKQFRNMWNRKSEYDNYSKEINELEEKVRKDKQIPNKMKTPEIKDRISRNEDRIEELRSKVNEFRSNLQKMSDDREKSVNLAKSISNLIEYLKKVSSNKRVLNYLTGNYEFNKKEGESSSRSN